ncbi:unnamed protein product [Calypogeia fissa]
MGKLGSSTAHRDPLHLNKNLEVGGLGRHGFTVVVRIAMIPGRESKCAPVLDRYSECYPVGGMADQSVPFEVKYVFEKRGSGELLMLSLPYHLDILSTDSVQLQSLSYTSIDGPLQGVVGNTWTLKETHAPFGELELVEWTLPVLKRKGVKDQWKGLVYALLVVYQRDSAHKLISTLAAYDEGNSLSNLLWWIHPRPRS